MGKYSGPFKISVSSSDKQEYWFSNLNGSNKICSALWFQWENVLIRKGPRNGKLLKDFLLDGRNAQYTFSECSRPLPYSSVGSEVETPGMSRCYRARRWECYSGAKPNFKCSQAKKCRSITGSPDLIPPPKCLLLVALCILALFWGSWGSTEGNAKGSFLQRKGT